MANQFLGLSNLLLLIAIFTDAEEFKSVKQQLKIFRLIFRQFNIFNWTSLQNKCFAAVNTSQMMIIPIYWTIESLSCWKVSASHQTFLLKSTKIPINRRESHIERPINQCSMQLLAANFISTIIQFVQNLLLFCSKGFYLFFHSLAFNSYTFNYDRGLAP